MEEPEVAAGQLPRPVCLSSVTDCVISAGHREVWHFFCDSSALGSSPFFTAALSGSSWLEGKTRCVHLPEDGETWFHVLSRLHGWVPPDQRSHQVHLDLPLLDVYQKYLLPELEAELLQTFHQAEWIATALCGQRETLLVFQQLRLRGVLQELLSSWCSLHPTLLAGPLLWWLRSTGDVSLVEDEVAQLLASEIFLSQSEDILLLLADLKLVDLLELCTSWQWLQEVQVKQLFTEDALMPLTQLPSLRHELRQWRFCQPCTAQLLQPFPRLLDDLQTAWFQEANQISPESLAEWAAIGTVPEELLTQQWQSLPLQDFQRFLSLAPLEQPELCAALRAHLAVETPPVVDHGALCYRLWCFRLASLHQLMLWQLPVLCHPYGCPKRWASRSRWKMLSRGVWDEVRYMVEALQALLVLQGFFWKVLLWYICLANQKVRKSK